MADADFAKGASGVVSRIYDSSASGLGLSPAYLANMNASASAAAGSGGGEAGTADVFANRPAAGDAINQFYYATDTGNLYFSNGTTWYLTPDNAIYSAEAAGGVLGGSYPNPTFAVDMATQTELNTAIAAAVNDGDTAGGVLSGTYPSPGFAVDMATQAELDAHINDTVDAHDASAISYVGGTGMSATEVESAIDELANEKANVASAVMDGDTAGGVLSGTYPSPGFAVDMATQTELDAVSAAAVNDGDAAGGVLAGTYPSPSFAVDMATQAELDAHINDTTDAHDASAISYGGGTGMSATDVEAAVDELATEKANVASAVMDGDTAGGVLAGTYPSPSFAEDMATQAELNAVAAAGVLLSNIDAGLKNWSGTGDPETVTTFNIVTSFNKTFASAPNVVTEAAHGSMDVYDVSTTQFTVNFRATTDLDGNASGSFYWIALRV